MVDDNYSSRGQQLSNSTAPQNVCTGITLLQTNQTIGCQERRFSRKLMLASDPNCLMALVQRNDICMLVASEPVLATAVSYNVSTVSISGKKKKGANKVDAGHVLCIATLADGSTRELTTPVGGQVLEMNGRLASHPELLHMDPQGVGYIAVIFPDSELPDFHNFESWKLKERLKREGKLKSGCCFAWIDGTCTRGAECKFTHIDIDGINESSIIPDIDAINEISIIPDESACKRARTKDSGV